MEKNTLACRERRGGRREGGREGERAREEKRFVFEERDPRDV